MTYSFEFSNELIYYQAGFESCEVAKSRLEEFAKSHCRKKNSMGKLFQIIQRNGTFELDLLREYKILVENGKAVLYEIRKDEYAK